MYKNPYLRDYKRIPDIRMWILEAGIRVLEVWILVSEARISVFEARI